MGEVHYLFGGLVFSILTSQASSEVAEGQVWNSLPLP